jgi:hypothetical protein
MRWATSMVQMLAIRKALTKRAMAASASSIVFMSDKPLSICGAWSSALAWPVYASESLGSSGLTAVRIFVS